MWVWLLLCVCVCIYLNDATAARVGARTTLYCGQFLFFFLSFMPPSHLRTSADHRLITRWIEEEGPVRVPAVYLSLSVCSFSLNYLFAISFFCQTFLSLFFFNIHIGITSNPPSRRFHIISLLYFLMHHYYTYYCVYTVFDQSNIFLLIFHEFIIYFNEMQRNTTPNYVYIIDIILIF